MFKICYLCKIKKSYNEFYKFRHNKDGYNTYCKDCVKIFGKNYREKSKEKIKLDKKEYREKNKEKIKLHKKTYSENNREKIRERNRKYRNENPDKVALADRKLRLRKLYGITLEQYEEMVKQQNGVCAICNQPETSKKPKSNKLRFLSVDHCHKTGKIRGLLCNDCNHGIGNFKDDVNILENAIKYLKK